MTINSNGRLRLVAFLIDWVVIFVWGCLVFGVVMLVSDGQPIRYSSPWLAQGVGLLAMTLPVVFYFGFLESSGLRASLGKKILGLQVGGTDGEPLPLGRSLQRNALKFIPWELGHLVAHQLIFSADQGVPGIPSWLYLPMGLSLLLPIWWVASMYLKGQTPYDQWSRARVEKPNW